MKNLVHTTEQFQKIINWFKSKNPTVIKGTKIRWPISQAKESKHEIQTKSNNGSNSA